MIKLLVALCIVVASYTFSFGGVLDCGQTLTENNTTYTLSQNLDCREGISIKGKYIIVDCNGYGLFPSLEQGIGIEISRSSFVTIKNCWVEGWEEGIVVDSSKNITLLGDVIVYNGGDGINFSKSKNTTIQDTVSEGNGISGFVEYKGSNTTIEDSSIIDNGDVDILLIAPKSLQFSLINTEGNFSLTKEGGN